MHYPRLKASSRCVEVHGRRLYCEVHGANDLPTVVLLHHGLGSTRAWKHQTRALAAHGWRAVAYDRWGYGASDPRPSLDAPDFTSDLRDLQALLDLLEVQQAALVGHSDGGTIALYFAAQQPGRVAALVVVAAHIYVEASMLPGIQGVAQAFESDARFHDGLRRAHGDKAESVFHNWYDGWFQAGNLSWDMRPLLGSIACPTLVVQGEQDGHASPRHARDIAGAVQNGSAWLIAGVQHMPPQEVPEEFNRRMIEFLEPAKLLCVALQKEA